MKGFDIYSRLDTMLEVAPYKRTISFAYIGNLPEGFRFRNATHIAPKHGAALAECIRQHHVYITASQNEPGSNHQNEGANCGLPLLFRESGCLPQYCHGFGVAFTPENFERKLWEMIATYDHWADRMKDYPHIADQMCARYYRLFVELLDRRDDLVQRRKRWRTPEWMLRTVLRR